MHEKDHQLWPYISTLISQPRADSPELFYNASSAWHIWQGISHLERFQNNSVRVKFEFNAVKPWRAHGQAWEKTPKGMLSIYESNIHFSSPREIFGLHSVSGRS